MNISTPIMGYHQEECSYCLLKGDEAYGMRLGGCILAKMGLFPSGRMKKYVMIYIHSQNTIGQNQVITQVNYDQIPNIKC